jgi:hypothetical protein
MKTKTRSTHGRARRATGDEREQRQREGDDVPEEDRPRVETQVLEPGVVEHRKVERDGDEEVGARNIAPPEVGSD